MKAALYLRSSKDRSDVSIDAQRRQLEELAAQRGIFIVAEFADAVESGKDDDRPGFQNMLRDMRNPKRGWDTVLVLDTARIARRRHISIIFEEQECKKAGIKVIYKSLPDSDPITEMLLKSILQAMDEWHSLTSKAKGLAGMAENVRQGYRAGGVAPKGYRLEVISTPTMRDGMPVTKSRLVPNDESMLVRSYMQQRAKGIPRMRALAFVKQDWPPTTLLSMERNALTYAGHTVWNRHAEKGEGGGYVGGTKYRPREEWVIQHNTHEPLISMEEAEAILEQVEARKMTRSKVTTCLLSGILVSPSGQKWHSGGDGTYRLGKGKRVSAEAVDRAVLVCVEEAILSDEFARAVLEHYRKSQKPVNRDRTMAKLNARVAELDKQVHSLAETLTETTAKSAILRSIERIEAEREEVLQLIEDETSRGNMNRAMKNLSISEVRALLKIIAQQLGEGDQDTMKQALESIVEQVTLDESSLTASVAYKIVGITGDKVASPRRSELIPGFELTSSVTVPHQKRVSRLALVPGS
jgi:site-specific DNA recombinase